LRGGARQKRRVFDQKIASCRSAAMPMDTTRLEAKRPSTATAFFSSPLEGTGLLPMLRIESVRSTAATAGRQENKSPPGATVPSTLDCL